MMIKWPNLRRGKARYLALSSALELVRLQQIRGVMDTREWLGTEFDRLQDSVEKMQPAHIDLSEELAGAILDKMRGPLSISRETSDWLKEISGGYPFNWTMPLGYSSQGGTINAQITAMGSLVLEMRNHANETVWRGEFAPPNDAE
jgi:hypothetical protein